MIQGQALSIAARIRGAALTSRRQRRDVVSYSGSYHLTNNPAKSGLTTRRLRGQRLDPVFFRFSSVATDLLLAVDVAILKTR